MFSKKTLRDVPLAGKRVLLRVDYNVPLEYGRINDDYRMVRSLPTLKYLLAKRCSIVICAHLGRPGGKVVPELSLEPIAAHLGNLLNQPVGFIPVTVGDRVSQAVKRLQPGQILMLENLRFDPGEEANDADFARRLAHDTGAAYFVQDGFGEAHREHASTVAITEFLPSVAGLLLETEVTTIATVMERPKQPLVAILGGAKVSDKIKVIEHFIDLAEHIVIGGAMANTFLAYKGVAIGKSIHETDETEVIDRIYAKATKKLAGQRPVDEFILLPTDVVVAPSLEVGARAAMVDAGAVPADDYILDLGADSTARIVAALKDAGTAVWSGTLGMTEQAAYAHASARVADALADRSDTAQIVVGGGDTADFVLHWRKEHRRELGYISTGGSASLQLMSGMKLPGVEALLDK